MKARTIKMQKVVKAIKVAYNGVTNEEARELVPVFCGKAAIKRVQSQMYLSYAEREQAQLKVKAA